MNTTSYIHQKIGNLTTWQVSGAAAIGSSTIDSMLFQPWDTYIKRVQSNQSPFPQPLKLRHLKTNVSSLFQGFMLANFLKGAHRSLEFAGESFMKEQLQKQFPEANSSQLHSISGCLAGALSALAVTPFDTLKVKKQLNENAMPYLELWKMNKGQHYKALPIIASRNAVGSAFFFGPESMLRQYLFHVPDNEPLDFQQKLINSAICPAVSVTASYPLDLVKTRLQSGQDLKTGKEILSDILKKDGLSGLYKGFPARLVTTLPRSGLGFMFFQIIKESIQSKQSDIKSKTNKI